MRKLVFLAVAAMVAGSLVLAACVGDSPAEATSGTEGQGVLNGACFANGTCNAGLSCVVVQGTAKCLPPDDGSTSSVDGSSPIVDAGTTDAPSGSCKFQTTTFPCGDPMPPTACFGGTLSCTLTGCNDRPWQCFSPRQCGTPCCVSPTNATLSAGANCTEGSLLMLPDATAGASCAAATACAAGETQLCQANSDCPTGQRCTPVKIVGPGAGVALNGSIVAACRP